MKVIVASGNKVKIEAVREMIVSYDLFKEASVEGFEVNSGVSNQPKSLDETIEGAVNRAKSVFSECDYTFGIESGLMEVREARSGFMNVCSCAIYDGKRVYLGLSSAFEYPTKVIQIVKERGVEINDAFHASGLTEDKKIGSSGGAINILTKGRLTRKDYTKQAVLMALIQLENKELYS